MEPEAINQASGTGLLAMILTGLGAFGAGVLGIVSKWGPPWAPKSTKEQDSATAVQLANIAGLMKEHRAESREALEKIDGKVDHLTERMVRVETIQAEREVWTAEERRRRAGVQLTDPRDAKWKTG